jgi:hypothetical protein
MAIYSHFRKEAQELIKISQLLIVIGTWKEPHDVGISRQDT